MNSVEKKRVDDLFSRSLSNASWLTGARLFGDISGLVLFVVFARRFGPEGIGVYAFALAIGQFVFSATNMGSEDYAIREHTNLNLGDRRILLGRLLGTQILPIIVFLVAYSLFVISAGEYRDLVLAAGILSAYQIFLALSKTFFIPAFSAQDMALPSILELSAKIAAVAISLILLLFFDMNMTMTLIAFPLVGIALLVASAISCVRYDGRIQILMGFADVSLILKNVWPFALSVIVFQIYSRADVVMLTLMLGEAEAGLYASALKFLEVGGMPLFYMGVATYPILSAYFASKEMHKMSLSADLMLRVTLILGGLLGWVLYCVAPLLVVPVFGEEFRETAEISKMLVGLALLLAISATLVRVMMAAHLQTMRLKLQSYAVVLNIVLNFGMIPLLGITGAIIASVVADSIANIFYFREIRKIDSIIAEKLSVTFRLFAICVCLTALAVLIVNYVSESSVLTGAVSLAVYLLMLRLTNLVDSRIFVRGRDLSP
jgi:O-antigen/teichoic acid export membrane protein